MNCCLCGTEIKTFGNNIAPIRGNGTCCDECNINYVIPMRLKQFFREEETRKKHNQLKY